MAPASGLAGAAPSTRHEPNAGERETQKPEVWVAFDADTVYVTFRCWEEHLDRIVARELRRDNANVHLNESSHLHSTCDEQPCTRPLDWTALSRHHS